MKNKEWKKSDTFSREVFLRANQYDKHRMETEKHWGETVRGQVTTIDSIFDAW